MTDKPQTREERRERRQAGESTDPQVLELKSIKEFVYPTEDKVKYVTRLKKHEPEWMARHGAFIKFMSTPLYEDHPLAANETMADPMSEIVKLPDGTSVVRKWNPPVFLTEANKLLMEYRISEEGQSRSEFLSALGKLGGSAIIGLMRNNMMRADLEDDKPRGILDRVGRFIRGE